MSGGMPYPTDIPARNSHHPRVYVASLSDYNNGRIHGVWVNACQDPKAILDAIKDMLAKSPEPDAEEWAVHDFEGFRSIRLAENARVGTISKLAQGVCADSGL